MLTLFGKKKLTEVKMANIFVNSLLSIVDESWDNIAEVINDFPEFVSSPQLQGSDSNRFLMIILVTNLNSLPQHFDAETEKNLRKLICLKMARVFEVEEARFCKIVHEYRASLARVNHPSKNHLYAMSKAVFYKYNLNQFQEDYFKGLNVPNPVFLKKLDDILVDFVWNWDNFLTRYRVIR